MPLEVVVQASYTKIDNKNTDLEYNFVQNISTEVAVLLGNYI
jgi:hypothetical protein